LAHFTGFVQISHSDVTTGLRSETSPDHARVSFYLYCSLDVNKDRMTL